MQFSVFWVLLFNSLAASSPSTLRCLCRTAPAGSFLRPLSIFFHQLHERSFHSTITAHSGTAKFQATSLATPPTVFNAFRVKTSGHSTQHAASGLTPTHSVPQEPCEDFSFEGFLANVTGAYSLAVAEKIV